MVDNQILSQSQKPIDEILTNAAVAGLPFATMGLKRAWRGPEERRIRAIQNQTHVQKMPFACERIEFFAASADG